MKRLLILFLLMLKPISAGSLLSKCFKSKPKVELTNLDQVENTINNNPVETSTNNNLDTSNQEQNAQERNRLLAKYLLSRYWFYYYANHLIKILEPLKIEKLEISHGEAIEKLKVLLQVNGDWSEFRHKAASLINSGANPNVSRPQFPQFFQYCQSVVYLPPDLKIESLLNISVDREDYFFAYFLLKRGAVCNKYTLRNAKTLAMTKLLITNGADPRETEWDYEPLYNDPFYINILNNFDLKLFPFYIDKYNYTANKKYRDNNNLLHMLLDDWARLFCKKTRILFLLYIGVNPFEKNDLGKSSIDIAREKLGSRFSGDRSHGQEFLEGVEEYNQIFKEKLRDQTKEVLPLELQNYVYKFHAGEDAEL